MSQKQRVGRLERKTGPKSDPVIWVDWGDGSGTVTVDGETMTRDEFKERWPDMVVLRVKYES